ncbi:DUF2125 domain-containing protein [Gymnodinialimonas ceratoperidinii]|uniref:DUF2125 domain-containing protein n=1 Tax=Gymnodinialimonas ceratoperidinii TaxID=2856823 RepID=A0A8F6TWP5_9RHOB|nr:DUF2125 domain-containing protein [Gymnodinialimonas ceratoperidinii]QXT39823.1 DUF2125 domain-containing protein [Gymnodinialimonas ceratoperidinii]
MKRLSYILSTLALAAASPAVAQTSAPELWAEWLAQAEATGQNVTADVTETDTGLTLSNLTVLFEDEAVTTRGVIDEIQMTENADGTISVSYSDLYTMTFTFSVDDDAPPANIEMLVRHENLGMEVSGEAGARVYAYAADQLSITEGRLWGGGSEPPTIDVDMVLTDLDSTYTITGTDPATMRFSSDGSLGGLTLRVELASPDEPGSFKSGLMIGPMEATSAGTLLSLANLNQADDALPEGFELTGNTTYASMAFEMLFEAPQEGFAVNYRNDGGSIGAAIAPDEMSYNIAASGARAMITGTDIPVPVEFSVGSSEVALSLPLMASDAPQDMGLRVGVQELVVGDALLSMVDPGRALPRDPMSLLFDASGQVQLFMDLANIDPDEMTGPPGELRTLSVNEMNLSVGGAALTGTADFNFTPGQIVPMPVGSADLELAGGNALLDALIDGGLVPNEQGAFIRGAANVFARPGAGPDTLETTVEFGADGSITANGIPLQ